MLDNRQKLLKYLKSYDLMGIATCGNRPTAATVYYGVDDDFNFYIITPPSTEHGKNILENGKIAAVVVDTRQTQFKTKYKIGVQIYGTAKQITNIEDMEKALFIWSKGKGDIVKMYITNISKKIWQSRPFVIRPHEIKWFNEKLYGKEGTEIFKL